jgi:hypothetical protein
MGLNLNGLPNTAIHVFIPPKRQFIIIPHGVTSKKMAFLIVTAVKTSSPTYLSFVWIYHCVLLHKTEINFQFCVEITTVAVEVLKFQEEKNGFA